MRHRSFLLISILFLLASPAFAQLASLEKAKVTVVVPADAVDARVSLIEGNVVFVHTGDIVSVAGQDGKTYSIRLRGIDAPENRQDFGERSRKKLSYLIEGMDVMVIVHKEDSNGRYLGSVFLDGIDVSLSQIETGMAWHYADDSQEQTQEDSQRYADVETKARAARVGLWESKDPMPPWDFRGDKKPALTLSETATATTPPQETLKIVEDPVVPAAPSITAAPSQRTYILGPRGGCYYVSESGRKVYVKDKTLCLK